MTSMTLPCDASCGDRTQEKPLGLGVVSPRRIVGEAAVDREPRLCPPRSRAPITACRRGPIRSIRSIRCGKCGLSFSVETIPVFVRYGRRAHPSVSYNRQSPRPAGAWI